MEASASSSLFPCFGMKPVGKCRKGVNNSCQIDQVSIIMESKHHLSGCFQSVRTPIKAFKIVQRFQETRQAFNIVISTQQQ
jgi:hypothetical protein